MKSREEILNALKTIQEVCESTKTDGCKVCPLRIGEKLCGIVDDTPCFWNFTSLEPEAWRAFKE